MIHYELRCSRGHEFDGWFKDSAAFDGQARCGLVQCPACGDTTIGRALMAPALARPAASPLPPPPPTPDPAPPAPPRPSRMAVNADQLPDHVRAALQQMRTEIERNCDYVGPAFADEARRIRRGEGRRRGIYGEASNDEAEALAEEGIKVARIPWVPRADS
jgi:hypothetical protein